MEGKVPDVIIVARHGARLDAADKSWHLSSPTPYDPPLTYGGWMQSRALGLRIAHLLHARLQDQEKRARERAQQDALHSPEGSNNAHLADTSAREEGKKKRKTQRIIMHSSPFLRCVQTSLAMSGGIASYKASKEPESRGRFTPSPRTGKSSPTRSLSPLSREINSQPRAFDPTASAEDITDSTNHPEDDQAPQTIRKTTLRIDAFLGEWLSPEYFEEITPPPNSTFMVANAKAELLRRADDIGTFHPAQNNSDGPGHFPGGWGKNAVDGPSRSNSYTTPSDSADALSNMKDLGQALPRRDRAGTQPSLTKPSTIPTKEVEPGLYVPPVPAYSIVNTDPIPAGYVAHARDACVTVDYQWDSMREPQLWGEGGEYGEEWSAMHRRFRKGLSSMVEWYTTHGVATPNLSPTSRKSVPVMTSQQDEDEEVPEEELILILVTHGAGCNALIGALTNQPVLIDVATASLTWARLRQPSPASSPAAARSTATLWSAHGRSKPPPPPSLLSSSPPSTPRSRSPPARQSSLDPSLAQAYEIRHLATTTHLNSGVDPARLPTLDSPKPPPIIPTHVQLPEHAAYRRRFDGLTTGHVPGGSSGSTALIGSSSIATAVSSSLSFGNLQLTNATGEPVRAMSAALGSARKSSGPPSRSWSTRSQSPARGGGRSDPPSRQGSGGAGGGLWSATRSPVIAPSTPTGVNDGDSMYSNSPGRDMVLNFGNAAAPSRRAREASGTVSPGAVTPERRGSGREEEERRDAAETLAMKPMVQQQGLWGTSPSHMGLWGASQDVKLDRDRTMKRRWTVND